MSKLTDKISYLRGLAEGMKLNPEKDSHRLILGILEVLGEVGESFEALAESHGELSDYVESIDEDLADLEADLYDDEDEDVATDGDDGEFESTIEYECPHCGWTSTRKQPVPNAGRTCSRSFLTGKRKKSLTTDPNQTTKAVPNGTAFP